ncbi:MAG: hypothetical protein MI867_07405, partial [Pseudomonadales bacterium]|nr:hypothetical protein [Pseudomonadales bacterium]
NNGDYRATVPGSYAGPVLIEITANTSGTTLMTCDSSAGCGSFASVSGLTTELDTNLNSVIDFGEQFPLDDDFLLRAIIPNAGANQSSVEIDVTFLTHLAAAYAESFPQGFDDLSAELAITQVASIFSIDANLLTLDVPSINEISAFSAASDSEKLYALISSSVANFAENDNLSNILSSLALSFAQNNGQLLNHSSDSSSVTISRLLSAANDNLNQLTSDPTLSAENIASQISSLKSLVESNPLDSFSNGQPSSTAGSSELEKVEAFIADLQQWEGRVSLLAPLAGTPQQEFQKASSFATANGQMLQAFALASQHSAIVAVPDLALDAACASITNIFTRAFCQGLIANYSIEEICETALNLTFFGTSLCGFLNDLTIPVGNGLWANYALYDGTARIFGELEGVAIDVTFYDSVRAGKNISFTIDGSLSNEDGEVEFAEASLVFGFAQVLTGSSLTLPDTIALDGDVSLSISAENGEYDFYGNILFESAIEDILGEGQTGYLGIPYSGTLSGEFTGGENAESANATLIFGNQGSPQIISTSALSTLDFSLDAVLGFEFDHEDLEQDQLPNSFSLRWENQRLLFTHNNDQVVINNQDAVEMTFSSIPSDGMVDLTTDNISGAITVNGTQYADISTQDRSLVVTLPNNTQVVLYQ